MNRSIHRVALAAVVASSLLVGHVRAEETVPTDGAPTTAARSRLTLRGTYEVATFAQSSFHLGGGPTGATSTDDDAFWAQNLLLQPRLIISDNCNVNLSLDVAQGIWGLESGTADDVSPYPQNTSLANLHLDWAYLAYRHAGTGTRWYLGRQAFTLGQGLVLDTDAAGLQVFGDLPRLGTFGLGFAKVLEAGGFSDANNLGPDSLRVGADGRDADLIFVSLESGPPNLAVRPFFVYYQDRSAGNGATLLPDGLPYAEARFHPHVTRATIVGAALELQRGLLHIEAEYDNLRGVDRIPNQGFGPDERNDVNNGDLTGSNLYVRAALGGPRAELGGVFAQGSGDPDPRSGEGNLNSIASDGSFALTEVWEDSVLPDRGFYPGGLGSPLVRGYRDLENTRIIQGFAAFRPRPSLRVFASASLIRASEALRTWSDANGDGVLAPEEFGPDSSTELGSELDLVIDWDVDERVALELAVGRFLPRVAASYLLYGHGRAQDAATEIRAAITVPIPEFSLGG